MTVVSNEAIAAKRDSLKLARSVDRVFYYLALLFAIGIAAVLLWILITLFNTGLDAFRAFGLRFLVTSRWSVQENIFGALPLIYGTIASSVIALLIAIPISVGIAIFLSEDFLPPKFLTPIAFIIELLAAVPSVVYGLWGLLIFIPFVRPAMEVINSTLGWMPLFAGTVSNRGLVYVGLVLAIMITPIIVSISRDTLVSLPPQLRQGALALGATRWETILKVLLPAGLSGIIGAIMLALGRALGETMVAAMLMGTTTNWTISIFDNPSTIAGQIANQFAEATGLQRSSLIYAGFILMIITLAVNMLAELIITRFQQVEK